MRINQCFMHMSYCYIAESTLEVILYHIIYITILTPKFKNCHQHNIVDNITATAV